jgi:hypothetical protein
MSRPPVGVVPQAPRSPLAPEAAPPSVKVDLAAELERLARVKANGVLAIEAARARARIELEEGRIARVEAPAKFATEALAAVLAAREAATRFDAGARLDGTSSVVDLSVGDALARARGKRP